MARDEKSANFMQEPEIYIFSLVWLSRRCPGGRSSLYHVCIHMERIRPAPFDSDFHKPTNYLVGFVKVCHWWFTYIVSRELVTSPLQ